MEQLLDELSREISRTAIDDPSFDLLLAQYNKILNLFNGAKK